MAMVPQKTVCKSKLTQVNSVSHMSAIFARPILADRTCTHPLQSPQAVSRFQILATEFLAHFYSLQYPTYFAISYISPFHCHMNITQRAHLIKVPIT
jgi:hypothetical protein